MAPISRVMPQIQVSPSAGKLNDRMIRHLRLLGSLAMLLLLLAEQLKNKVQQEKHINLSWIGMLSRTRDSKDSAVDNSGGDLAQWFWNLFQTNYGCMNPSHKLFSYQGYIYISVIRTLGSYKNPRTKSTSPRRSNRHKPQLTKRR